MPLGPFAQHNALLSGLLTTSWSFAQIPACSGKEHMSQIRHLKRYAPMKTEQPHASVREKWECHDHSNSNSLGCSLCRDRRLSPHYPRPRPLPLRVFTVGVNLAKLPVTAV